MEILQWLFKKLALRITQHVGYEKFTHTEIYVTENILADDGVLLFNSNHWLEWESSSPCPVTCGMGIRTITRQCFQVTHGGCSDDGELEQEEITMCYPGDCAQGTFIIKKHETKFTMCNLAFFKS